MIFGHSQHRNAFFATDFREYPLAAQIVSSDWTERSGSGAVDWNAIADTASFSGRVVLSDGIGNDIISCTWDRLGANIGSTDFDVLALVKRTAFGAGSPKMCGITRTANDGESGVAFGFDLTSEIEISEYSGGLYVNGTQAAFSSDTSTFYWLRWSRVGNIHTGKVWAYGSAESTATSVARSTSRAGGNIGMFLVNSNGIRCAWFSAAAGVGAVAPGPWG